MTAKLLEGKPIAAKIEEGLRKELGVLEKKYGTRPHLVAARSGANESTELYLRAQKGLAERLNISFDILDLSRFKSEKEVTAEIKKLSKDGTVNGIFVPMPLSGGIDSENVLAAIDPKKDVEGVHSDNLGLLALGKGQILPCTAQACMALVDSTGIDLYGKEVVIVGASKVVGNPIVLLMLQRMATTTVCHIGTYEKGGLKSHVGRAEVLVVAVGKANLIPGEWIKKGAIVIDIGINRVAGKTVGDVEFEAASKRASYITPVPGGVGPLTVMLLMKNLVTAFKWQKSGTD